MENAALFSTYTRILSYIATSGTWNDANSDGEIVKFWLVATSCLCYYAVCCVLLWSGMNSSASVELRHPAADQLVHGAEVSLRCQVEGHPEPAVEWYRNRNRYEHLCTAYCEKSTVFIRTGDRFEAECCNVVTGRGRLLIWNNDMRYLLI